MLQRSWSFAAVVLRPRGFLIGLIVAGCGPTRTSPPRPRPPPVVIAKSDATAEVAMAAEVQSVWLTDAELEAWLRAGCGPIETAAETSALTTVDPKLAKLASAGTVFGAAARGTIVHEREGELWLVSADGARRRRLTRQAVPADDRFEARWTDDGRSVTFTTHHGHEYGRRVVLGAHCESARVLAKPSASSPAACDAVSPDGRLCLVRGANDAWFTLSEPASGNSVTVAAAKWKKWEQPGLAAYAWTSDGLTMYLVARFRGSEPIKDKGESTFMLYDWSPLYRLRLPKTLSTQQGKTLEPEYVLPGDTSANEASVTISHDNSGMLWLQGFYQHHVVRADVDWIRLPQLSRMSLGARHKLVGAHSWVNDARWSPDDKHVLLTIGSCSEDVMQSGDPCAAARYELVVADEQRAAFVAPGRRAAWTEFDALL